MAMASEGAATRKSEENLTLVESLRVLHHHGDSYRSFKRDSPISDPLERIAEFTKLKFGPSSGAEYTRFTAEAREPALPESSQIAQNDAGHLPSNGGGGPIIKIENMLTEDEIKIEYCPMEYGNNMVEVQHMPIDIKREVISIEGGPEVPRSLPKSGLLSCGQCRTRSGDFWTMVELEEHIKKVHGGGQSHVTAVVNAVDQGIAEGSSTLEESINSNNVTPSKRPRLAPPKDVEEFGGRVNEEFATLSLEKTGDGGAAMPDNPSAYAMDPDQGPSNSIKMAKMRPEIPKKSNLSEIPLKNAPKFGSSVEEVEKAMESDHPVLEDDKEVSSESEDDKNGTSESEDDEEESSEDDKEPSSSEEEEEAPEVAYRKVLESHFRFNPVPEVPTFPRNSLSGFALEFFKGKTKIFFKSPQEGIQVLEKLVQKLRKEINRDFPKFCIRMKGEYLKSFNSWDCKIIWDGTDRKRSKKLAKLTFNALTKCGQEGFKNIQHRRLNYVLSTLISTLNIAAGTGIYLPLSAEQKESFLEAGTKDYLLDFTIPISLQNGLYPKVNDDPNWPAACKWIVTNWDYLYGLEGDMERMGKDELEKERADQGIAKASIEKNGKN